MSWNVKYSLLLVFSTCVTYFGGRLLAWSKNFCDETKKVLVSKGIILITVLLNIGLLFYFKYTNFLINNINMFFSKIHINRNIANRDILLPVGISFFIFQALGYIIDVYRGEIEAEKNIFRYALFVSFFPQLVAGPIERSKNLLYQLREERKFNFELLKEGCLLMLWGFFLKMVIADRVAIFVDAAYGNPTEYSGCFLVVATILFAFQIYCDFYGYSTIARGTAKILGIDLMENFRSPYFSQTVSEFWRRWHISLSSWFKDYLYIPLGGNRRGKLRRNINLVIVFAISGLWHGASWAYVIWGLINGIAQIIGDSLRRIRNFFNHVLGLKSETLSHKIFRVIATFLIVDFAWLFFRAGSLREAVWIIKNMCGTYNPWVLFDKSLYGLGLDDQNFHLMIYSLIVLLFADLAKMKGLILHKIILKQEYWFQGLVFVGGIIFILIYGMWGSNYDSNSFIYFQF